MELTPPKGGVFLFWFCYILQTVKPKYFRFQGGKLPLPLFFPDATRGFVKSLDSQDVVNTKTPGVLVNTYHLWNELTGRVLKKFGGIRNFMGWKGGLISDSGGFQVMSLFKKGVIKGKISDEGIVIYPNKNAKTVFTPEESIRLQVKLGSDMVVVLDDFTDPNASYNEAKKSVERTLDWAERSKRQFEKIWKQKRFKDSGRPYILGVVQGGEFSDLREMCTRRLVEVGFDGLGWGGWPFRDGILNFNSAEIIAKNTPSNYLLYGLGIGKPEDIVACVKLGYSIFDCVLPTRDARHGRLYVYDKDFYSLLDIRKAKFSADKSQISKFCDCLLCKKYSRAFLYHVFKQNDPLAFRLASVHNLRFYSSLMEKLHDPDFIKRIFKSKLVNRKPS